MSGFIKKSTGGSVNVDSIQGLEAFDINATYAAGDNVKEGGRIWESIVSNNTGHIPSADNALAPVYWKEISASHLQNTDTRLKRSNGTFIHADTIANIADLGTIYWVSNNGNNTTAVKGRIDRPFATMQAAQSQLQALDNEVIVLLPGIYNQSINDELGSRPLRLHLICATINGDIINQNSIYITGDSQSSVNGYISANQDLYIRNLHSITCNGKRGPTTHSGNNFLIENIDTITFVNPSYGFCSVGAHGLIRNVRKIVSNEALFHYCLNLRLENIGLIQNTVGRIDNGQSNQFVKSTNVVFKASGDTFQLRGDVNKPCEFTNCLFISDTGVNFGGDNWNANFIFNHCKFIAAGTYHIGHIEPSMERLHYFYCQYNKEQFLYNPNARAITSHEYGYNVCNPVLSYQI